jgi:hypothetical protein
MRTTRRALLAIDALVKIAPPPFVGAFYSHRPELTVPYLHPVVNEVLIHWGMVYD